MSAISWMRWALASFSTWTAPWAADAPRCGGGLRSSAGVRRSPASRNAKSAPPRRDAAPAGARRSRRRSPSRGRVALDVEQHQVLQGRDAGLACHLLGKTNELADLVAKFASSSKSRLSSGAEPVRRRWGVVHIEVFFVQQTPILPGKRLAGLVPVGTKKTRGGGSRRGSKPTCHRGW